MFKTKFSGHNKIWRGTAARGYGSAWFPKVFR